MENQDIDSYAEKLFRKISDPEERRLLKPGEAGRRTRLEIVADIVETMTNNGDQNRSNQTYNLQEYINILEATKAILILKHDEKSRTFFSDV